MKGEQKDTKGVNKKKITIQHKLYQIIKLSIPPSENLAAERQIYNLLHFPLCLGSSLVYTYVPSKICSSVACNFRDSLRLPIWACGWRLENFNCVFNLRISRVVSRYLKLHSEGREGTENTAPPREAARNTVPPREAARSCEKSREGRPRKKLRVSPCETPPVRSDPVATA